MRTPCGSTPRPRNSTWTSRHSVGTVDLSAEATEEACLRLCNLGNVLHVLPLGPKNEAAVQQPSAYSAVMRARLRMHACWMQSKNEKAGQSEAGGAGQRYPIRLNDGGASMSTKTFSSSRSYSPGADVGQAASPSPGADVAAVPAAAAALRRTVARPDRLVQSRRARRPRRTAAVAVRGLRTAGRGGRHQRRMAGGSAAAC